MLTKFDWVIKDCLQKLSAIASMLMSTICYGASVAENVKVA